MINAAESEVVMSSSEYQGATPIHFEKGSPGARGFALYAVVCGFCIAMFWNAPIAARWAGVVLSAIGAILMLLSDSSWLRKPMSAGLFDRCSAYRSQRPKSLWYRVLGVEGSLGWVMAMALVGLPVGTLAAYLTGYRLDMTATGLVFMFGGMASVMLVWVVAQTIYMFSNYVVVRFSIAAGAVHAVRSAVDGVDRDLDMTFASVVQEGRTGVIKVRMLLDHRYDVHDVKAIVTERFKAHGVRPGSDMVVASMPNRVA